MKGGGEERGQQPPTLKKKEKECEVHVGAEDKPSPPPHRLLRLNIKPMINTSCSFLRFRVNKNSLSSLTVLQKHNVGSIASMCPLFFCFFSTFTVLIFAKRIKGNVHTG